MNSRVCLPRLVPRPHASYLLTNWMLLLAVGMGLMKKQRERSMRCSKMDGFSSKEPNHRFSGNFPKLLDLTATRPGRFDRHVEILRPTLKDRESIL